MSETIGFVQRTCCNLCGAEPKETLLSKAFADPLVADFLFTYYGGRMDSGILGGASYTIIKCSCCGFIWQESVLNAVGMQALYDEWISAAESLSKRHGYISRTYFRQADMIGALFSSRVPADISVLDFGMGWGYWCEAVKAAGYRVTGLELSQERIKHGKQMGIEVIEDLGGQQFDFINAEQVFEHIAAPRQTLQRLTEHLNPGGIVHIAVPDGTGIEHALKRSDWKPANDALLPLEHINCFTRRTLLRLGETAGLRVITLPLVLTRKYGWKALVRSVAARYYRQFFGAGVYFRKLS